MVRLLAPGFLLPRTNHAARLFRTPLRLRQSQVCALKRNVPTLGRRKQVAMVEENYRLAPSDFAFLWEECKRCFYLKVHGALPRPRAPFPSIFTSIDLGMKRHMSGLRTNELFPGMRPGTFLCEDDDPWIECLPIIPPGQSHGAYIRGKIDALIRFDDGTFGIIDFKTSSVAKTSSTYSRQLHAYAAAMENPSDKSQLKKVLISELGLVVYTPSEFHTPLDMEGKLKAAMTGGIKYVKIERDDPGFHQFLGEVIDVLKKPEAPSPKLATGRNFSSCPYCNYLHQAQKSGLLLVP